MNSSFFVIADRGNLKAFRAENSGGRGPTLKSVKSTLLAEAHLKASEKYSDAAGGFYEQNGAGFSQQSVHQNSAAEKHYELEENRRIVKQLTEQITEILQSENVEGWSFAAPAQIQEQILSGMDAAWRNKLCEKVPRDLVHIPTAQLLEHFSKVRAAEVQS